MNPESSMPRHVWAMWFGPEMTGNRRAAYNSLKANIGVELKLVTQDNLKEYEIADHPFHPALSLPYGSGLSGIGIGDYLRVYFMHFYGGGYHDVKPHDKSKSWAPQFDAFEKDPELWMIGIAEGGLGEIGCDESYAVGSANPQLSGIKADPRAMQGLTQKQGFQGALCTQVKQGWKRLLSNVAYIMRPQTPLTEEWLRMIEEHLNAKFGQLKHHPAPFPRCCNGRHGTTGDIGEQADAYPYRWAELHGEAFHVVQFKYSSHLRAGLPRYGGEGTNEAGVWATSVRNQSPLGSVSRTPPTT